MCPRNFLGLSGREGCPDIGQYVNPKLGICTDYKNHLQTLSDQNADPAELHNMIAKVFLKISVRISPCCPDLFLNLGSTTTTFTQMGVFHVPKWRSSI